MRAADEIRGVSDVPVVLEVELDRITMSIREILALERDSVLELSRSAGENVEISVGGTKVGWGEIVVIEDTMGVRLTDFALEGDD